MLSFLRSIFMYNSSDQIENSKDNSYSINRITLDYRRIIKIETKGSSFGILTWEYAERLIIDRETETIEHIQFVADECKVSHKYEVKGAIENMLDKFELECMFIPANEKSNYAFDETDESQTYTMTVDYQNNPKRIIKGIFNKNGLPEEYSEFAETVLSFIKFYDGGEIFNQSLYNKAKKCDDEYIFCSVIFKKCGKRYYYLTDDDSIEIGDFVIVSCGQW